MISLIDYNKQKELIMNSDAVDKKDKLKKHNDDLLRKLRNRVKEVKKLQKYSLYKEEFSRLNKKLQNKDKIIVLMAEQLTTPIHSKEWVKEYYKKITKEL